MSESNTSKPGVNFTITPGTLVLCVALIAAGYLAACSTMKNAIGGAMYSKQSQVTAPAVTNTVVIPEADIGIIVDEAVVAGRTVTGTNWTTLEDGTRSAELTIVKPEEVTETFAPTKLAATGVRTLFGFLPIPGGTWAAEAVLALMLAGGAAYGHKAGKKKGSGEQESRWKTILGKTVKGMDVYRQTIRTVLAKADGANVRDADRAALKAMKKSQQGAEIVAEIGEAVLKFTDENTFTEE